MGKYIFKNHDCQEKLVGKKNKNKNIKKSIPKIIAFLAFHVLSHNNFRY